MHRVDRVLLQRYGIKLDSSECLLEESEKGKECLEILIQNSRQAFSFLCYLSNSKCKMPLMHDLFLRCWCRPVKQDSSAMPPHIKPLSVVMVNLGFFVFFVEVFLRL